MNINKDNYQAFLLDLSEGILSEKETEGLYAFLDEHPELDVELLSEPVFLFEDEVTFPNKAQLDFENITPENRSFFFVGHIEKQLNAAEEKALTQFLDAHPMYVKELESFGKAKVPEINDTYPNKKRLLAIAKTPVRSLFLRVAGVAALFVVFFMVGMHYYTSQPFEERYSMKAQSIKVDLVKTDIERNVNDAETIIEQADFNQSSKENISNRVHDKTQNPSNELTSTSGHSTDQDEADNQSESETKIQLTRSNTPRIALQLESIIHALNPKKIEEPIDASDFAKISKEPLTVKEYLVAKVKQNPIIAKAPKKQDEFLALLNDQMGSILGSDQYIAKKEADVVKTHISFGGFSFYRSRAVE